MINKHPQILLFATQATYFSLVSAESRFIHVTNRKTKYGFIGDLIFFNYHVGNTHTTMTKLFVQNGEFKVEILYL